MIGADVEEDRGFTLLELLIAIVLIGVLSAVAIVGIGGLVRKGSEASCTASADAARAASAIYFASHTTYPTNFAELTVATGSGDARIGAPLALPSGVTATGLVATSPGGHWTLSMAPGTATVAPTFACATTLGSSEAAPAEQPSSGRSAEVPDTAPCNGTFSGWRGEYFSNISLAGAPTLCRDDAGVNFDWTTNGPTAALPADRFSVRWTRTQDFAGGQYRFTLGTDDGGRLYIDGTLVLDRWIYQSYPFPQPEVTRTLTAGPHTIVVEYFEGNGYSRATLVISGPT